MQSSYDVVVIGSGFGGAVVACRMAEAGRSVAVLERGRRWDRAEFPRAIGQVASEAFWDEGRSHGFLEYVAGRRVDVIQGSGVGGGSLHYFNVNIAADPSIFSSGRWPVAISRNVLDPYYEMALDVLQSKRLVPPSGRTALPERSVAFLDAARHAGYDTEQVTIAVRSEATRVNPITGLEQNPCTYCGNCLFGCDIGAKYTLDSNYLALAERVHGAEILPLHAVEGVAPVPSGGYDVSFRRLNPDPSKPGTPGVVHGRAVVVSAGTIGSTALLLSCRDRARTLPRLPAALGHRFSVNGELLLAYVHGATGRIDPGLGPPITARATVRTPSHLITVEDLGLPDSLMWYLEGSLPPSSGRLRALAALLVSYAKETVGLDSRTSRLSLELESLLSGGRTPHVIPLLGMGTDSSDGEIRLDGDGIDIRWNWGRNRKLYREMIKVMAAISEAAGGQFTTSLLYRWPLRKVLTAHPLGGCAMGDDPATSVVNDRGAVWNHPGLHVVDGSMIPAALAVNPSLTIAALAERAAHLMTHGTEIRPTKNGERGTDT